MGSNPCAWYFLSISSRISYSDLPSSSPAITSRVMSTQICQADAWRSKAMTLPWASRW
ncbi:hypothetical protein J2Z79_003038 [Symbiobacterium terraclitae]|uniref:Uncharacterized protein n=1 Tax=Symbiobacterium terraclitae TaxID=557451 RepID=A0ABS4JX87_9FIRM|nr:hypothetical protein [Symbiobacterium terraclitae]